MADKIRQKQRMAGVLEPDEKDELAQADVRWAPRHVRSGLWVCVITRGAAVCSGGERKRTESVGFGATSLGAGAGPVGMRFGAPAAALAAGPGGEQHGAAASAPANPGSGFGGAGGSAFGAAASRPPARGGFGGFASAAAPAPAMGGFGQMASASPAAVGFGAAASAGFGTASPAPAGAFGGGASAATGSSSAAASSRAPSAAKADPPQKGGKKSPGGLSSATRLRGSRSTDAEAAAVVQALSGARLCRDVCRTSGSTSRSHARCARVGVARDPGERAWPTLPRSAGKVVMLDTYGDFEGRSVEAVKQGGRRARAQRVPWHWRLSGRTPTSSGAAAIMLCLHQSPSEEGLAEENEVPAGAIPLRDAAFRRVMPSPRVQRPAPSQRPRGPRACPSSTALASRSHRRSAALARSRLSAGSTPDLASRSAASAAAGALADSASPRACSRAKCSRRAWRLTLRPPRAR
jgi:hypothetical protein